MTTPVQYSPQQAGRNVTRVLKSLLEWHEVLPADVAGSIGMTPATIYRRMKSNDWHLDEAAAVAVYFGIRDVSALLAGRVLPAETEVAVGERSCMNSLAMTFEQAS